MKTPETHPRLRRILALLLGCSLALSADYVVRQVYLLARKKKPTAYVWSLREAHPVYHHGLKPNASGIDTYGPYSAPAHSNSLGLRDAQVRDVPLQGAHPRILFIGDSFTEAAGLPWEKSFVGRIADTLAPRGIEVLNAGVVSYTPALQKAKLRHLLEKVGLKVDLVVLALDISDVKDELFYEERPDGTVVEVPYGPQRDKAAQLQNIDRFCNWLETRVEKNFVILGAVVRNLRLLWRRHASEDGITIFEMLPTWAFGWPDYRGPYEKYVEAGLAKAKENMSDIHSFLQSRGVPLVLVIYPWPQQILAQSRPSRAETEWLEWARQEGVRYVNLFPLFVNSTPPQEILRLYYWENDCHWNEEGHRLVAETLLQPDSGIPLPQKSSRPGKAEAGP